MRPLIYLTKRSMVNKLKKAVHKPTTLLILIFGIAYGIFLAVSLGIFAVTVRLDSVRGLVILVTLWCIYIGLSNYMSYSSRKGIIFRPAHAQFVFTAPISPKLVLINSAWMNYLFSAVVWLIFSVGGITVFQVPAWRVALFFVFGFGVETVIEISAIILLYTGDSVPEKAVRVLCMSLKVFLIGFTLLILLYFKMNGLSAETAGRFIDWPVLQVLPLVGWQIAMCRLILLGPDLLNVICSVLYLLTALAGVAVSLRMRCEGGYYEEAARFADDYAELRNRKKNGEMVMSLGGKKRKFRRIREHISGSGAKAIFCRQLLEYKKERFFIFSKMTLVSVFIAVVFSYSLREAVSESGYAHLYLLGIVAYVSLVMTGYLGKWESELKNPYLYMIPDSAVKKLWYATLMEHFKALADAALFCVPLGIFWKIPAVYVVMCILIYAVLQANRLYSKVIAQCLAGETFGKTGQNILRAVLQMTVLGAGAGAAVLTGLFVNADYIFPIILIYSMIVTVAVGILASLRFETMEQIV